MKHVVAFLRGVILRHEDLSRPSTCKPHPTNPARPLGLSGEEWRRSCSATSQDPLRLLRDRIWWVDGPKQPWGTPSRQSSELSLPLTAWCSPVTEVLQEVAANEGWRGGGGSSTVHEGFFFLFSKISNLYQKEINALSSRRWWRYTVKAMNQSQRSKPGEPVGDRSPSGIRVCRWNVHWECLQSRQKVPSLS